MGNSDRQVPFSSKQRKSRSISKNCFIKATLLIALNTCSFYAASQLTVVSKVGPTKSITAQLEKVQIDHQVGKSGSESLMLKMREGLTSDVFFPLKPNKMSPGQLKSKRFKKIRFIRSFAVVGSDELSKQWLAKRYASLVQFKSPILVIEAKSMVDIQTMSREFPNLRFAGAKGDGIGLELEVSTYPFFVNGKGVWQ